jgi:hypothetical protein
MTVLAYDITESSVTFIADDGLPRSAHYSHPNYSIIRDELLSGTADVEQLILLVDSKLAIEGKAFGLVTVGADAVWYKDQQIQGYLIDKLLAMLGDGVDITPWAHLLDNLMRNPEPRARERLPLFLTENGLPITRDGYFLAWRLVKVDYWDIYTGSTFKNEPGAVLEMDRSRCNPDPDQTCSDGIHVAAFSYLGSYGFDYSGRRCMLVKVNPADVVAVPTDYNNAKLRTCKIEVLREVAKELVPALFGRDDHITSEHGYVEDEFDSWDDDDFNDDDDVEEAPPAAPEFYLANEAGEWLVVHRPTGKVQFKFTAPDQARDHVRKLNS